MLSGGDATAAQTRSVMKEGVPPPCEYVAAYWASSHQAAGAAQLATEPEPEPEPEPESELDPEPVRPGVMLGASPQSSWCEASARAAFRRADEDEAGWITPGCVPTMLEELGWAVTHAQAALLFARMSADREDAEFIHVDEFCRIARWASEGVDADAIASPLESGTAQPQSTRMLVLRAVLGGVMELPPEGLLKTMDGACRPYQYSAVVQLVPEWNEVPLPVDGAAGLFAAGIEQHTTMELERWMPSTDLARETSGCKLGEMAHFNVHRFTLRPSCAALLRSLFGELAMRKESQSRGIEVSNTDGGWHSGRDLFRWLKTTEVDNRSSRETIYDQPEEAVAALSQVAANVLNAVEQYERSSQERHQRSRQGLDSLHDEGVGSIQPTMLRNCDAWLNINRGAAWNRPHTHEGARWSVVYYVADGSDQSQRNGECSQGTPGSDLLLIPKHSAKATQWQLTAQVGVARCHQRRSGCAMLG